MSTPTMMELDSRHYLSQYISFCHIIGLIFLQCHLESLFKQVIHDFASSYIEVACYIKFLHLELEIHHLDLENVENFEDSSRVDCDANEPKIESSRIVRKCYILINLQ